MRTLLALISSVIVFIAGISLTPVFIGDVLLGNATLEEEYKILQRGIIEGLEMLTDSTPRIGVEDFEEETVFRFTKQFEELAISAKDQVLRKSISDLYGVATDLSPQNDASLPDYKTLPAGSYYYVNSSGSRLDNRLKVKDEPLNTMRNRFLAIYDSKVVHGKVNVDLIQIAYDLNDKQMDAYFRIRNGLSKDIIFRPGEHVKIVVGKKQAVLAEGDIAVYDRSVYVKAGETREIKLIFNKGSYVPNAVLTGVSVGADFPYSYSYGKQESSFHYYNRIFAESLLN